MVAILLLQQKSMALTFCKTLKVSKMKKYIIRMILSDILRAAYLK
jgi:hypothetical protein